MRELICFFSFLFLIFLGFIYYLVKITRKILREQRVIRKYHIKLRKKQESAEDLNKLLLITNNLPKYINIHRYKDKVTEIYKIRNNLNLEINEIKRESLHTKLKNSLHKLIPSLNYNKI
jgi:hypothetical protein